MLNFVTITNYALIESAAVELKPGFNVITGESGAGKSIFKGAIELLLGGRVDRGVIRSGSERCTIAGVFTVPERLTAEVAAVLDHAGVAFEPELREVNIRRVITTGAVRNFINDAPVGARLLGEVGRLLLDCHGVNEHLSLLMPSRQLEYFDRYAGAGAARERCAGIWTELEQLAAERAGFTAALPDAAEADRLSLIVEEIESANPEPGEDEVLAARHRIGANAQEVVAAAGELGEFLTESEDSLSDRFGAVHRRLAELARIDENTISPLLDECDRLQENLAEFSRRVMSLADTVETDPEALAAMEERLSTLHTLKRRYGPTLEQVLATLGEAQRRLEEFRLSRQRCAEFDRREAALRGELEAACAELSALRRRQLPEFLAAVREKSALLGFPGCRFEAEIKPSLPSPSGADEFELLFSANVGEEIRPLRRIASSGELSRLMLALKTVLADADAVPTVVFDEIDMNIGGETANMVGAELHQLGRSRQIICISHLAQVAVRADAHFLVEKETADGRTRSRITLLEQPESELARMLGGGEAALRHAAEMTRELKRHRS